MGWVRLDICKAVDAGAASIFAAATGYAASYLLSGQLALAAAPAALALAYAGLRRVETKLPQFLLVPLDSSQGPSDGTVVRIFAPAQPAIARPSADPPDAAEALSDALAELKRSLS